MTNNISMSLRQDQLIGLVIEQVKVAHSGKLIFGLSSRMLGKKNPVKCSFLMQRNILNRPFFYVLEMPPTLAFELSKSVIKSYKLGIL